MGRVSVRGLAVVLLVLGVATACERGDGDDEPVTLPDEAVERSDTATYRAPGGRYSLDVPSAWAFDESGPRFSASPAQQDTPVVSAELAPLGDTDLDAYVTAQVADSEVPVEVEEVDVAGASQARSITQHLEGGGRTLLIAVDEEAGDAVVVDVVWSDGELTPDDAAAIVGSLRLGDQMRA